MLMHIVQATPVQIWFLLAGLIGLGVWQSRPRSMTLGRVTTLPVVMLVLSALAVLTSFHGGVAALAAWGSGIVAALALGPRALPRPAASWSAASGRLDVAGSWLPLALILALFIVKYVAGASLAMHPELAAQASFAVPFSFAYGFFSGLFASRALQLRAVRRQAA